MTTPSDFQRTSTGQSTGGSARRQATDKASGLKDSAQHLAGDVQERATEAVEGKLGRQKSRAARTLHGIAQSLRESSQNLQEQETGDAQQYVDGAARQVDRLADFLQRTDVEEIGSNLEDFARRQPALFLGGAFVLGVIGARFLKSSQRGDRSKALTEYRSGSYDGEYADGGGYGSQTGYGTRSGYGSQPGYGTQSGYGASSLGDQRSSGATGGGLGSRTGGERDVSSGLGGSDLADVSRGRTGGTGQGS